MHFLNESRVKQMDHGIPTTVTHSPRIDPEEIRYACKLSKEWKKILMTCPSRYWKLVSYKGRTNTATLWVSYIPASSIKLQSSLNIRTCIYSFQLTNLHVPLNSICMCWDWQLKARMYFRLKLNPNCGLTRLLLPQNVLLKNST